MKNKEKASLISEAEFIYPVSWKTNKNFPKYIIIREVEEWDESQLLHLKIDKKKTYWLKNIQQINSKF